MFTTVLNMFSIGYDMSVVIMKKFMITILMLMSSVGYGARVDTFLHEFLPRDTQFSVLLRQLIAAEPYTTVNVRVTSPGGRLDYMWDLLIIAQLAQLDHVRINWLLILAGSAGALAPWMDIGGHIYYSERSWVIFHSARMVDEKPDGTFTYRITNANKEWCWKTYQDPRFHFPLYPDQVSAMCKDGADVTVYLAQLEATNAHPCFSGDDRGKLMDGEWCEWTPK